MKKYPPQQKLKELFYYREDGYLIRKTKFSNVNIGDIAGSISKSNGYSVIRIDSKNYQAHRLIFIFHKGYDPESFIDHIDQTKLNNRIENLREVSNRCNQRNTGNWKTNKSGVKGVFWYKIGASWQAHIRCLGGKKYLGRYKSFHNAVCARLAAEQCLNWSGCDSNSPAFRYVQDMIKGGY